MFTIENYENKHLAQKTRMILQEIFTEHRIPYYKHITSNSIMFKMNVLYTYTKHIVITPTLTYDNILFCIRPILETCPFHKTNFNTEKQKMEIVLFLKFFNSIIIPTNRYAYYANSNSKNRTIVRKLYHIVQFSTDIIQ